MEELGAKADTEYEYTGMYRLPQINQTGIIAINQQSVQRQRLMLEALLRTRFGELDEVILGIIDSLLVLSPDEFMPLCLQLSREEVLERFGDRPS